MDLGNSEWEKEWRKRLPHLEHLKSSIVRDEFHSIVGLSIKELGFERAKEDLWLKPVTDEIQHAVLISALKGLSHKVCIGIRLSFAPRLRPGYVRDHIPSEPGWESLDLVHYPYSEGPDNPAKTLIDAGSGHKYLRKDIRTQHKFIIPYMRSYFANADSLTAVLDMYEAERVRKHRGLGFKNHARHLVSYPFLLARLGMIDKAIPLIETELDRIEAIDSVREKTMDRLHEVAALGSEK